MNLDVYFYGTVVASTIHRLRGDFPALDTYGEIEGTWKVPGGEAMNGAIALSRLGLKTAVGGPQLGTETGSLIRRYAQKYGIELGLRQTEWTGLADLILVDDHHRTVFGSFGNFYSSPVRRWDPADAEAIRRALVVCVDPWFPETSEEAARVCVDLGRPYVTIDCPPESFLARNAAALVISGEFRRTQIGVSEQELFDRYRDLSQGLVVFSSGSGDLRFGRRDREATLPAFSVPVVSTLGAGDVFRAGIAWGLVRETSDEATVRFAAALAALVCTRMPIADTAPTLAEVQELLASRP